MARAIALLGFTGSGKTAAGQLLAQRLGVDFVDVHDAEQLADEVLPDTVLAIGGGMSLGSDSLWLIRTLTRSFWLDAPLEVLWARTPQPDATRIDFEQRFRARRRWYVTASHRVDASRPLEEVVETLAGLCGR